MALSVDFIYQYTLNLIKKNQAGSLSSTEWARHWNDAQSAYMDDLLGRFQARNNGKTGMNTGMIENETIESKLSPFTKNETISISGGNGNKPTDFIYKLGLRINGDHVFHINKNQIATINDSVIDPPSITNGTYYFTEYQGYYSFLPNTVTEASLDYIATLQDVVWGFTISGGRQIYNSGTSTQPLWDNNSCREITRRVLDTIGISYKDSDLANFGNRVVNSGN